MLCERVSLFTNTTRVPGAIVRDVGLAPAAVMVIVRFVAGGSVGDDGELEPQEAKSTDARSKVNVRGTGDYGIPQPVVGPRAIR
jgi:hypothetical protein